MQEIKLRTPEQYVDYKFGKVTEQIYYILQTGFKGVVENGLRDRQPNLPINQFIIGRILPNPNIVSGTIYQEYPEYPVYVVCPKEFKKVDYEFQKGKIIIDYSGSLSDSPYKHGGQSIAFEPEVPTEYSCKVAYGEYKGFSAPSYTGPNGDGGSGLGMVAAFKKTGERIINLEKPEIEYAVIFVGIHGDFGNTAVACHAFTVVK